MRNTFIIFLVSGLWHGANWTFLAWGAYHALFFLPLILRGKNRKYRDVVAENRILPNLIECGQMLLTFLLVVFGWIIFRSESIGQAWEYFTLMFNKGLFSFPIFFVETKKAVFFAVVMLLVEWAFRKRDFCFQIDASKPKWISVTCCYVLILAILEFAAHSQSFIYFQF